MSAGSPRQTVRIPEDLLQQIVARVERSQEHNTGEPFTVSSLIVKAVVEKLDHYERSRKTKKKRLGTEIRFVNLRCEECSVVITLQNLGRITNQEDGIALAECWECVQARVNNTREVGHSE